MDNYKSATLGKTREMVEAQIKEEIHNGRYEVVSAKLVIRQIEAQPYNLKYVY